MWKERMKLTYGSRNYTFRTRCTNFLDEAAFSVCNTLLRKCIRNRRKCSSQSHANSAGFPASLPRDTIDPRERAISCGSELRALIRAVHRSDTMQSLPVYVSVAAVRGIPRINDCDRSHDSSFDDTQHCLCTNWFRKRTCIPRCAFICVIAIYHFDPSHWLTNWTPNSLNSELVSEKFRWINHHVSCLSSRAIHILTNRSERFFFSIHYRIFKSRPRSMSYARIRALFGEFRKSRFGVSWNSAPRKKKN